MKIDIFWCEKEKSTKFTLIEPVFFSIGEEEYVVPAGFVSDGGSIPRGLWSWCNPLDARWLPCFLRHDWIYTEHLCTKKMADDKLYQDLRAAGMPWAKAQIIHKAVRAFGGRSLELKYNEELSC